MTALEPTLDASNTAAGVTAPDAPLVTIVLPTRNRASWLREALQTLVAQQMPSDTSYEIVVVDNNSTDATPTVVEDIARKAAVDVRYLFQPVAGDAPTRNAGIREARGEWIAFFDDDQFADPCWLAELLTHARLTRSEIVGGPVHLAIDSDLLDELGPHCRAALREAILYPVAQSYSPSHLPGTGNALVARAVFDRLGLFDESFVHGGSDCDFFTRARDAGVALWYAPRAIIRHRVEARRLTPEYLRQDAFSGGAEHARYFDYERGGLRTLPSRAVARIALALFIHTPMLLLELATRRPYRVLGRLTRLWRLQGYLRTTIQVIANDVACRWRERGVETDEHSRVASTSGAMRTRLKQVPAGGSR